MLVCVCVCARARARGISTYLYSSIREREREREREIRSAYLPGELIQHAVYHLYIHISYLYSLCPGKLHKHATALCL